MRIIRRRLLLIAALTAVVVAACKVQITVPQGGRVTSQSGAYWCNASSQCVIDVYDTYFDEVFTAVPNEGYEFSHWRERYKGFCGAETGPCRLSTSEFRGHEPLMEVLESDTVFYLDPVFISLPGCYGDAGGKGKNVTLRQGEYAAREVAVEYKTNLRPRSRFEGCPAGMCSVRINWDKSYEGKKSVSYRDIIFTSNSDTPVGTYKIQYLTYRGGRACDWMFGCVDTKERDIKRHKFQVKVVACPA